MVSVSPVRSLLLSSAALLWLVAQPAAGEAAVQAPAAPATGKRTFTAADFARFAPRTALDMVRQVPGFTIRGADQERGLGQASENVLINGERVNNKSGGATDELSRLPAANVERIELVEAASMGIAGLTGQVANVIVKAEQKASGQFEWNPSFRAHYAKPQFLGGSVSYSGETGPVDYTLSVNHDYGRGAFGGPIRIIDPDGLVTERRSEVYRSEFEQPRFKVKLGLDGIGSSVGNLTLLYGPYWNPTNIRDRRTRLDGDDRRRTTISKLKATKRK